MAPPNCLDYLLAGETYSMTKVLHSSERCLLEHFSIVCLQVSGCIYTGSHLQRVNRCKRNYSLQVGVFNILHCSQ